MRSLAVILALLTFTALFAAQQALTFPPPKVVPPDKDTAAIIAARTSELEKAADRLSRLGVRDPNLADIEIFIKAAKYIVKHGEFYKTGAKQTVDVLAQGLLRANQQSRGDSPWLTSPQDQTVIRAFRSRIDGSLQPYAVTYPADYGLDRRKRYRVDVVLHGRNAGLTEVSFIANNNGKKAPKDLPFVQIDIYGRGNNAYRWAGETDVWEALEHFLAVEGLLNRTAFLDQGRVMLRGFSMGGAGTWHIGLHRPDQFCVIGPGAGFTTTHGYIAGLPKPLPPYQEACLHIYDAIDYAENAFNVPIVAYSGEDDKQKAAADLIEERLKKLKIPITHIIAPKTGHRFIDPWKKQAFAEYDKQANRGRDDYPPRVRFVTWTLRYPSCNWVDVLGLEKHYTQASVDARKIEDGFIVKTGNVRILRLALWPGATREPINVSIDGQKLENIRPYLSRSSELLVYLEKRDGKWTSTLPERLLVDRLRTPQKSTGLQGPIDDAFMSGFLCVRGTGTAWHEKTDEYAKANLARFQAEWSKYLRGEVPVKDDTQVTAEDMATKHLILLGDPASNSLIADVLPRLPLGWTKKSIKFAGKEYDAANHVPVMIYPSPLATNRYVVLNSGHTFHAADFKGTNALLYPRLGDHAILKLIGDKKDPLASEVQMAGIFDDFWHVVGGAKP